MDTATVQRFLDGMKYETERTGPPEGFPTLPDMPAGRYTDPGFLKLESRAHVAQQLAVCLSRR